MSFSFHFYLNQSFNFHLLSNHPIICITGTDTGVGKTVITALLAKELAKLKNVITQKWVQSGDLNCPDIFIHDQLSELVYPSQVLRDRQVYSFSTAASPHLAASLENQMIDSDELIAATRRLSASYDTVLIETSGGIMVPLNNTITTGDVVAQMNLPTILVVPNKLGSINHSLLTINYLKQKGIKVVGFILNQFESDDSIIQKDNPKTIQLFGDIELIGTCASQT